MQPAVIVYKKLEGDIKMQPAVIVTRQLVEPVILSPTTNYMEINQRGNFP